LALDVGVVGIGSAAFLSEVVVSIGFIGWDWSGR